MTALLTDNLPLLAGAPNGIKKLRELILELAVRGKLVAQDPSDEPVRELLKRIAEEKARLVAEGKIKKQKPLAELADKERPFELPQSWEWRRISELLPEFQNGASSRGDADGLPVTVLRLADIRAGEISLHDTRTLVLSETTVGKYTLEDGDILLIRVNGSADLVGRFVVCRANLQAIPCDHFIRMRFPRGLVDSAYLKLVGDSDVARSAIAGLFVSTAGQKTVNQGHIGSLSVPFPPLAEQHRIVAKVDELMALCDRLEARQADADSAHTQLVQALLDSLTQARDAEDFAQSWQRLAEHFHTLFTTESSIDALKQTLLQLAVMGKLVPQDPSDEPASELLKRIADEKAQLAAEGRIKKQKPLDEILDEERPLLLPPAWAWVRPEDFSMKITDGEHFKPDTEETGVYFLSAKDIRDDGVSLENPLFISEEAAKKALQRCDPQYGDLLIVSRGATVGRMCKVNIRERFCLLGSVILIKPSKHVLSEFLSIALKSPDSFRQLVNASGSTAQPAIYLRDLKKIALPMPPLAEQHRIVAKVDQLMELCDQLKARLNQARQVHEQLACALVEQAVA